MFHQVTVVIMVTQCNYLIMKSKKGFSGWGKENHQLLTDSI